MKKNFKLNFIFFNFFHYILKKFTEIGFARLIRNWDATHSEAEQIRIKRAKQISVNYY